METKGGKQMALVSNLYPPIVQDTSVVFSKNTPCRIYF